MDRPAVCVTTVPALAASTSQGAQMRHARFSGVSASGANAKGQVQTSELCGG
jgi:hypothetical protein